VRERETDRQTDRDRDRDRERDRALAVPVYASFNTRRAVVEHS